MDHTDNEADFKDNKEIEDTGSVDSHPTPEADDKEEEHTSTLMEDNKEDEEMSPKKEEKKEKKEEKKEKKEEKKVTPAVTEKLKEATEVTKEPKFESVVQRTKYRLEQLMKNRKKLEELTFKDFFVWKNPIWSLVVFGAIQGSLLLLASGYSVLSLFCWVFLIQLLQSIAFMILDRMGKRSEKLPQVYHIKPETVDVYLDNFKKQLNCAVTEYVNLLTFTCPKRTGIAAFLAVLFGYFFRKVSGLLVLGLTSSGAFIIPLTWILFDTELKKFGNIAYDKLNDSINQGMEVVSTFASKAIAKLPKSNKAKTE